MNFKLWHIAEKQYVHWTNGRLVAFGLGKVAIGAAYNTANRFYGGTSDWPVLELHNNQGERLSTPRPGLRGYDPLPITSNKEIREQRLAKHKTRDLRRALPTDSGRTCWRYACSSGEMTIKQIVKSTKPGYHAICVGMGEGAIERREFLSRLWVEKGE